MSKRHQDPCYISLQSLHQKPVNKSGSDRPIRNESYDSDTSYEENTSINASSARHSLSSNNGTFIEQAPRHNNCVDRPEQHISPQYLGFKHDLIRYLTALAQWLIFICWLAIGVVFSLTFVIWLDFSNSSSAAATAARSASVFMGPTVFVLFFAFFFAPYTGINPKKINDWDTPLVFRWSTRGTNPDLVCTTVSKSYDALLPFGNFALEVCTDHPIGVPKLTHVEASTYTEIIIPPNYMPPNGSKFKARALHYGSVTSTATRESYIVHLDEESVVTEEFLLGVREFVSTQKGFIGQGIITYAREGSGWQSWLAWMMDAVRVGDDYGRFRFQLLIGRILVGMKGSYMLIPNALELDYGFDHGVESSITEDCWFAFCFPDKIRFCNGKLVEQSPFNLFDVMKQRRRWATGLWKVVLHHPTPWYNKFFMTFQMITWLFAWINLVSVVCGVALSDFKMDLPLVIYNGLVFGVFNFQYSWGIMNLKSETYSAKFLAVLAAPFLLPFFVFIEGLAGYWGTFFPAKGFDLVQKQNGKVKYGVEGDQKV